MLLLIKVDFRAYPCFWLSLQALSVVQGLTAPERRIKVNYFQGFPTPAPASSGWPLPVTDPPLRDFFFKTGRHGRGHHVDAHMRTLVVVEVNCTGYGRDDFSDACKAHVFKEFVFHCIVDSLRLGVVFVLSEFGHADTDILSFRRLT